MKYIHTLTGLRGLAALIVFISHSAKESLLPNFLGVGFGQVGVMIFFILSGFLMSHLYIHEDFNSANVKKYALARIGRVFPLYFALIIISIIVTKYFYNDFLYDFSDTVTVIYAFAFINAPYVFWSIPVEVQFYLIFMGFWFLYKKHCSLPILLIYIALTMTPSVYIYLTFSKLPKIVSLYSYAFFIGVGTALIQEHIRNNSTIRRISTYAGYPIIILLFMNTPIIREQYGLTFSQSSYINTWGDPATWIIIYSLFICAILNSKSLAFLNYSPFVYLGKISYGFYLIHYPVLMYFKMFELNPIIQFILALIVTIFISYLSYNYYEKPLAKRIKGTFLTKPVA